MHRRNWNVQDEIKLLELEEQGCTKEDMAEYFGRSYHSIESKLNKLHIKRGDKKDEPENARRPWTDSQLKELADMVDGGKTIEELVKHFNRTEQAIVIKVNRIGKKIQVGSREWTPDEDEKFKSEWSDGSLSIRAICKNHNRTWFGLRKRALVLNLGPRPYNTEYVSVTDICQEMHVSKDRVYNWFKLGLKKKKNRSGKTKYTVDTKDLLNFLESHPDHFDASKISEYLFPEEPEWLIEKRKTDKDINIEKRRMEYTNEEDKVIEHMFCRGMSDKEIAERLHRTPNGIQCRRMILCITKNRYMPYELEIIRKNSPYMTIQELSKLLPLRTARGIQSKCEQLGLEYHISKNECKIKKEE